MKKISKIIVHIMSTLVIVFLLPLFAIAGYSSWTQTSQEDFGAGTSINIDTTTVLGTIRLKTSSWQETTTADFNAGDGVIKDNIDTANNEIKLLEIVDSSKNVAKNKQTSGNMINGQYFVDERLDTWARQEGKQDNYINVILGSNRDIYKIRVVRESIDDYWQADSLRYSKLRYYDGSWHDISGTTICHNKHKDPGSGFTIYDNTYNVSMTASQIQLLFYGIAESRIWDLAIEIYIYCKEWRTGHFRSQEKSLTSSSLFGKFYESHLPGQGYVFKVRRYSGGSWSNWITVTNGNKTNLSAASKVQYFNMI